MADDPRLTAIQEKYAQPIMMTGGFVTRVEDDIRYLLDLVASPARAVEGRPPKDYGVYSPEMERELSEKYTSSSSARPHEPEQAKSLLERAVDDRQAHPWRYYRLEHDEMKKWLDKLSAALSAKDQQLQAACQQRDEGVRFLSGRVEEEFNRAEQAEAELAEARQQLAALRQTLEKIETMTVSSTPGFIDMSLTVSFMRHEARAALAASRAPQGETTK